MKHVFTNDECVSQFFKGNDHDIRTSNKNIFAEEGILYSYGRHFPLAVKMSGGRYLLNGDKYSNTTYGHQSSVRSEVTNQHGEQPNVSFLALFRALRSGTWRSVWQKEDFNTFEIMDFAPDQYRDVYAKWYCEKYPEGNKFNQEAWDNFKDTIPFGAISGEETLAYDEAHKGEVYRKWYHRIGSVLLRVKDSGKLLLCSMDEGSYFIVELDQSRATITNINEAFKSLKPDEVFDFESTNTSNMPVLRQGEWFFIPVGKQVKGMPKNSFISQLALPRPKNQNGQEVGNRHVPTRSKMVDDIGIYCFGRVYHRQPNNNKRTGEHRVLTLEKNIIYYAVRNTALNAWSANGRVD